MCSIARRNILKTKFIGREDQKIELCDNKNQYNYSSFIFDTHFLRADDSIVTKDKVLEFLDCRSKTLWQCECI